MSDIVLATTVIRMDEPCYSIKEVQGPAPDSRSVRRWQDIAVVRQDRVVHFRRDLGRAEQFTADEFVIPGGVIDQFTGRSEICHTVGELVDIADHIRGGPYEPPPRPEPTDLIAKYKDLSDKRRRRRRALSQFGPGFVKQRS